MKSRFLFVIAALNCAKIVSGQWGAVAEQPEVSLGNHYHWDALKSNPILLEYQPASHMDFFRSD